MKINTQTFLTLLGIIRLAFNRQRYLSREFLSITFKRIKEAKVNYFLGFSACFVVVLIVSLMVTIISNSPVIFLRLAELQKGEIDISCEREDAWWTHSRVNYTLAAATLKDFSSAEESDQFSYHTARLQGLNIIE